MGVITHTEIKMLKWLRSFFETIAEVRLEQAKARIRSGMPLWD
jgi:hypothetical protein